MQLPLWKQILKQNFTKLDALAEFLQLSDQQRGQLLSKPRFPLNVPLRIAQKMLKGSLEDPLFKQFVPTNDEHISTAGFVADPVADAQFRRESKLLHKYQGRVLLVTTGACAMHCRYCFRQNFDYNRTDKLFHKELEIIAADETIHEVILSGGDPLSLSNDILADLLKSINGMPHIRRIRFHSRFPIGIPERIDDEFVNIIAALNKQVWLVVHINHPRELDTDIFGAFRKLQKLGCIIMNQSVLLKGINDNADTLSELCETLADKGVIPYYLHQLDRVEGASHFEADESQGLRIIEEISRRLPGYAVPKFVREIAGQPNKTPII